MSTFSYLLQRSYASSCLDIVKMKAFVPCEVEDAVITELKRLYGKK